MLNFAKVTIRKQIIFERPPVTQIAAHLRCISVRTLIDVKKLDRFLCPT